MTTTAACVHRWLIESPNGPVVHGRCRLCSAERDFPVDYEQALAHDVQRLRDKNTDASRKSHHKKNHGGFDGFAMSGRKTELVVYPKAPGERETKHTHDRPFTGRAPKLALTANGQALLNYVIAHDGVKRSEIEAAFGWQKQNTNYHLAGLRARGLIEARPDPEYTGRYTYHAINAGNRRDATLPPPAASSEAYGVLGSSEEVRMADSGE